MNQTITLSNAIKNFKSESNKDVFAYGDYFTQSGYMLASQADSIFIHPLGSLNLTGYRVILSHFKEALDKWDIKMAIYKAGKYKGYTEAFTNSEPSPENKEQYMELIEGMHGLLIDFLSTNKGRDASFWEKVIANDLGARAQSSLNEKLVDAILHEADYKERIRSKYNFKKSDFLPLSQYRTEVTSKSKKANVAYVVMEGPVVYQGEGISSENLKKEFKHIRESGEYEAVVIRMNSGGGSAFASEEIWNEIEKTKAKGIPVIASVGNVAASGGYYIIMNSDKIFAQKNSILGSIGVFMLFPQLDETMKKHVGINYTKYSTSPYNPSPELFVPLTPEMEVKYQNETDFIYKTFVEKVASGRDLPLEKAYEIAEGRVYIGSKAKELGLVDEYKSLLDIKNYLKETYDLDQVVMEEFPKQTDVSPINQLSNIKQQVIKQQQIPKVVSSSINEASMMIENSLKFEPRMELLGFSIN